MSQNDVVEKMTLMLISSCSYIQFDLGQLKVRNEFSWHGGKETDPSAVRLDVLHAEVSNGMRYQSSDYIHCISLT